MLGVSLTRAVTAGRRVENWFCLCSSHVCVPARVCVRLCVSICVCVAVCRRCRCCRCDDDDESERRLRSAAGRGMTLVHFDSSTSLHVNLSQ